MAVSRVTCGLTGGGAPIAPKLLSTLTSRRITAPDPVAAPSTVLLTVAIEAEKLYETPIRVLTLSILHTL